MLKSLLRKLVPHSIWERARQARIRADIRRFIPFTVTHNYGGVPLKIRIGDGLAQGWYDHDWSALPEIELLARGKLRPGARVFDCGAHQGVVALMIRDRISPGGSVIAVEGMQHNCDAAMENARLNDALQQIQVVHAAIADKPGRLRFAEGLNGAVAQDGIGAWVEAVTIDQLSERFGPPDVLFIDIEGFEGNALRGARETLARHLDCYVEVHVNAGLEQSGDTAHDIVRFFDPGRYELYTWPADENATPGLLRDRNLLPDRRFCLVALSRS